jgi:hypothetical protein
MCSGSSLSAQAIRLRWSRSFMVVVRSGPLGPRDCRKADRCAILLWVDAALAASQAQPDRNRGASATRHLSDVGCSVPSCRGWPDSPRGEPDGGAREQMVVGHGTALVTIQPDSSPAPAQFDGLVESVAHCLGLAFTGFRRRADVSCGRTVADLPRRPRHSQPLTPPRPDHRNS